MKQFRGQREVQKNTTISYKGKDLFLLGHILQIGLKGREECANLEDAGFESNHLPTLQF